MKKNIIINTFLFSFFCLTLFKIFSIILTTFDLFGDEAQYWLWSQDLDFGYYSKPPLIAWILRLYTSLFGNSFEALKLLPIIFYFFTSFALYSFCRKLNLEKNTSLICSLSFLIMPAVSVSSFLLSTDVFLLLFWILSMSLLLEIKKNQKTLNFLLLGIMLGLTLLTKYAGIYFFICFLFIVFFDSSFRTILYLNKKKFILFLIVLVAVVLPNIIWNLNYNWLTFEHTSHNANLNNINPSLIRGLVFLIIQILMIGPILFLGLLINIKSVQLDSQDIFLLSFSIPIIIIVFFESIIVRANANWAALGLVCMLVYLIKSLNKYKNFLIVSNFFINFCFSVVFFGLIAISYDIKLFDRISGVKEFSKKIMLEIKNDSTIVVSNRLLYSGLAYAYKKEKIKLLMPLSPNQKITKHFQLKNFLEKENTETFVLLGDPSEISYLEKSFGVRFIKELNPKFLSSPIRVYEVYF